MDSLNLDKAEKLLIKLVKTPSVSGNEKKVAEKLVDFFEENGRNAWIDKEGNVRAPGNNVLLTSHMDTVPGRLDVKLENGKLHGRGAVDAKGPLTAMAVAAVNTGASFAGVVREETDSKGAEFLIQDMDSPDYLVNGEPTGSKSIALGYRGSLVGRYSLVKELFHSSRPENNAIQKAIHQWSELEKNYSEEGFDFIEIKPLEFNSDRDGFQTSAKIKFQIRIPPSKSVKKVKKEIPQQLEGELKFRRSVSGVMQNPRTEIARVFRSQIRETISEPKMLRKTGTCDMNRYAEAWDCEMLTYGPGNSDLDHTPDEHIEIDEFKESIKVLESVVTELKN